MWRSNFAGPAEHIIIAEAENQIAICVMIDEGKAIRPSSAQGAVVGAIKTRAFPNRRDDAVLSHRLTHRTL